MSRAVNPANWWVVPEIPMKQQERFGLRNMQIRRADGRVEPLSHHLGDECLAGDEIVIHRSRVNAAARSYERDHPPIEDDR
jgi:hypothetical protein